MKRNTPIMASLLMAGLLSVAPQIQAQEMEKTYGETVNRKLLSGLANITTSTLEIPKTIINISNQSNFAFGFAGGVIKGGVNTVGRIGVGLLDLITAPIPTRQIVYPLYVWDDFDAETKYGPALRVPEQQ